VFLAQLGLDKPFTGGLGSFKLYCLIAQHLQQLPDLADQDAGALLLSFLAHHGDRSHWSRQLKICIDGPTSRLTAEFAGVHLADQITEGFRRAGEALRKDGEPNVLGRMIEGRMLRGEREAASRGTSGKGPPISHWAVAKGSHGGKGGKGSKGGKGWGSGKGGKGGSKGSGKGGKGGKGRRPSVASLARAIANPDSKQRNERKKAQRKREEKGEKKGEARKKKGPSPQDFRKNLAKGSRIQKVRAAKTKPKRKWHSR